MLQKSFLGISLLLEVVVALNSPLSSSEQFGELVALAPLPTLTPLSEAPPSKCRNENSFNYPIVWSISTLILAFVTFKLQANALEPTLGSTTTSPMCSVCTAQIMDILRLFCTYSLQVREYHEHTCPLLVTPTMITKIFVTSLVGSQHNILQPANFKCPIT